MIRGLAPIHNMAESLQPEPISEVLEAILNTNRECVLVVGKDNLIRTANAAANSVFGRGSGSLTGRRLTELIRDVSIHDAFRRALQAGESSEIILEITAAGSRKYDVHVAPVTIREFEGAVGYFYDITQIERLETVRQEFLSNISHELRTPLTSILAFVETLEDGAIDDKDNNRRFLSVIRRNSERMHSLITDILELSFIESGNVSIEFRDVGLKNIVDQVNTDLASKAAEREVRLINEVAEGTLVRADPFRLEQMLMNLVDNAIKFNRPGGSVTVSHSAADDRDWITVSDTGEGIMADQQQRVFERFYRVDRARTREVGGTGLGLAIVKHLARLQGGEVSVRSKLGVGTEFAIQFPRASRS